jgi:hypothetical protein
MPFCERNRHDGYDAGSNDVRANSGEYRQRVAVIDIESEAGSAGSD